MDRFIEAIAPALRPDLSSERAAAIFWTLTLPYLYQELVEQAGWSPDDYEIWLSDLLIQQLLAS